MVASARTAALVAGGGVPPLAAAALLLGAGEFLRAANALGDRSAVGLPSASPWPRSAFSATCCRSSGGGLKRAAMSLDPVDLDRPPDPLPLGHARRGRARWRCWPGRWRRRASSCTPGRPRRHRQPLRALGPQGASAHLRLQRPYRRGAARATRRAGPSIPFGGRDARRLALGAGRDRHEVGRRGLRRRRRATSCAETPPDGAIVLDHHRRRGGRRADGTRALLDWMAAQGEAMTVCLVGEPTCPERMGEMIKIGRRGSMTAYVHGDRGAGPFGLSAPGEEPAARDGAADGPAGASHSLDDGTDHFDPSTLADHHHRHRQPGDQRDPGRRARTVNIRFNDAHSSAQPRPSGCSAEADGGRRRDRHRASTWRSRSRAKAS